MIFELILIKASPTLLLDFGATLQVFRLICLWGVGVEEEMNVISETATLNN